MKKQNELQQAINMAFTNAISIIENLGETTGLTLTKPSFIYKTLEPSKMEAANDLASQIHGLYLLNFFEQDNKAMIKISGMNGQYILPASIDVLTVMKKHYSKAWGQCEKVGPDKKITEKIQQENIKKIESIKPSFRPQRAKVKAEKRPIKKEIKLRLNNETFEKVRSGQLNFIRHGFSKNKKYMRLFEDINNIELLNENKTQSIMRKFKSIVITEENNKQIFKIEMECC
jgi:hypothetical protein